MYDKCFQMIKSSTNIKELNAARIYTQSCYDKKLLSLMDYWALTEVNMNKIYEIEEKENQNV